MTQLFNFFIFFSVFTQAALCSNWSWTICFCRSVAFLVPLLCSFQLSNCLQSYIDSILPSVKNDYLVVAFLLAFNFAEGLCWARTADRQTSRMRVEYLKSVLRQDVGFFDTQAADSSITFQVVSTISSDSSTVQVAIGEKVFPYSLLHKNERLEYNENSYTLRIA